MKYNISIKDFNLDVLKDIIDKHIHKDLIFEHKTTYSVTVAQKDEIFTNESYHFDTFEHAIEKYNEIVNKINPYYIDLRWYNMFRNDIPLPNGDENWIPSVYDIIHNNSKLI